MPRCIWRPRDLQAVVNSDPAEVLRASTSKARWDPRRSLRPARPNWPRSRSSVPLIGPQLATEDKTHAHSRTQARKKKATAAQHLITANSHHLPRLWPSFETSPLPNIAAMKNIIESCSRLQFAKVCTESQRGSSNINPAQQCCGVKHCSRSNKLSVYLSSAFSQDLDFSLSFRLIKVGKNEICWWKNHKSSRVWTLWSGAGFTLYFIPFS